MTGGRPLVVCYHAVSETWPDPLAVEPRALEAQLRAFLRYGFRPVTGSQVLTEGRRLLHVTFDDAFRSVLGALPVLERLKIPATVFACPSLADGGLPLAVSELEDAIARYPTELSTMRWEELKELAAHGVTIGSHTLSHPHLTKLSDRELHRELRESRERIEDELGAPCKLFAYPYGEHDSRVRAATRAAGYEAAFALHARRRQPDPYALPRVAIWRTDRLLRILLKTSPLPQVVYRARQTRAATLSRLGSRSR
ncbi:MAG: polysaccharide deacetylase family protein [Gaiellaceae bacterium]